MKLEQLPLVLAVIVGLAGSALLVDAFLGDGSGAPATDRRRRIRAERHRVGEALVGLGLLAAAAGLAGRDSWRYGTLVILGGGVLLLVGTALNGRFLGEYLLSHGSARRQASPSADAPSGESSPARRQSAGPGDMSSGNASSDQGKPANPDDRALTLGGDEAAVGAAKGRSSTLRIR